MIGVSLSFAVETPTSVSERAQIIQLKMHIEQLNKQAANLTFREQRFYGFCKQARSAALITAILFAAIGAVWAQKTERNVMVWLIYGLILNVFLLLVIIAKKTDSRDHSKKRGHRYIAYY